jgi:Tfp pilus assembly protein PilX
VSADHTDRHELVRRERGAVLVLVLLVMALIGTLGLGVVALSNTETAIASNYRIAAQTLYAADAGAARALADLGSLANWSDALAGTATSPTFFDPVQRPTLPWGEAVDVDTLTSAVQRQLDRVGDWGTDNPVWRLFASGSIESATGASPAPDPAYLMVWIADDPTDGDGDPLVDSNHVVRLLSRAFGRNRAARAVMLTVARIEPAGDGGDPAGLAGLRILTWREVR